MTRNALIFARIAVILGLNALTALGGPAMAEDPAPPCACVAETTRRP